MLLRRLKVPQHGVAAPHRTSRVSRSIEDQSVMPEYSGRTKTLQSTIHLSRQLCPGKLYSFGDIRHQHGQY